jgi:hypothetical protein
MDVCVVWMQRGLVVDVDNDNDVRWMKGDGRKMADQIFSSKKMCLRHCKT